MSYIENYSQASNILGRGLLSSMSENDFKNSDVENTSPFNRLNQSPIINTNSELSKRSKFCIDRKLFDTPILKLVDHNLNLKIYCFIIK